MSRTALFDELVKIGEAAERKHGLGHALKTSLVAGAGAAAGSGLAELVTRKLPFFQQQAGTDPVRFAQRARAAKIILPILGVSAGILGQKARGLADKEYSKVKGFRDPKNVDGK